MPERIAFRMNLNPRQAAEYELRHNYVFPELAQALKDAGVSDYSMWLDEDSEHLFAILTRADDHTLDALPDTEICKRGGLSWPISWKRMPRMCPLRSR